APAAYKEIRLEVFSVCNGDGAGITEWQLAGSANVAAANFTATPGSGPLAFGNVPVSTISSAQTVTLNNVGDAAGTVSAATVTGAFAFADPLPGTPTYSVAASGAAVYNIVLPAQTLP
ncbi:MAG: hypothetical protein NT031_12585, partial [Planctomycetota bacterium]|nr:hypothetical protein [Planctomycetota bacterium]